MTTIHIQRVGDQVLLPQSELDSLLQLARQTEEIRVQSQEADDIPTLGMMRLADLGGAFEFWKEAEQDLYSEIDGEAFA